MTSLVQESLDNKVIVVGAGAAGLMAAGQAALQGAEVTILEKMHQPGIKLSITGKGRCNITNALPVSEFSKFIKNNYKFLKYALHSFSNQDVMDFFEQMGINTITERGYRVFPATGKAADIVNGLIDWNKKNGVRIITHSPVVALIMENNKIAGVKTGRVSRIPEKIYKAYRVIITTGGAAYPSTGSDGDGYKLAASAGHNIEQVRAALVPLITGNFIAPRLQGLSLKNTAVSIFIDGKKIAERFGELVFTHFGLSGPAIISISRYAVEGLNANSEVVISLDLKPALDDKQLDSRLLRDLNEKGKQQFSNLLKGLLPRKMIPVCLELIKIDPSRKASQINSEERKRLRVFLKNLKFNITGYRPFSEAIVTAGGVNIKGINPKTMESRLIEGLYFAGEVMDVDADTGGFNLQIAFSTGWVAGNSLF